MGRIIVSAAQTGKSCPYCRFPLKGGAEAMACDRCGAIHHLDCWSEGGGCAVVGCIADHALEETTEMAAVDRSRKVIPVFEEALPQPLPPPGNQPIPETGSDGSSAGGNWRAVLIGLGCGLVIVVVGLGALFLTQGSSSNDADPASNPPAQTDAGDAGSTEAQISNLERKLAENKKAAVKMSQLLDKSAVGRSLTTQSPELALVNRQEILSSLQGIDGALGSVEQARLAFIAAMRESILSNRDRAGGASTSIHDQYATNEKIKLMNIWNSGVAGEFGLRPISSEGDI